MFEILLCSHPGLNHARSFEIINTRIDDRQFVWYYFYVRSQILKRKTRTKILSEFEIILKLPTVKSCTCLLELPQTEFEAPSYR